MAGIKLLDKNPIMMGLIVNALLMPEIKTKLFDDVYGIMEIEAIINQPRTVIYGVFEQGKPEPLGVVYFTHVIPYRGCVMTAVIFDPEKRHKGKMEEVSPRIKFDLKTRFQVHSIQTYVIGDNPASFGMLEKLGFKKVGVMENEVMAGGKYQPVHIFHLLMEV